MKVQSCLMALLIFLWATSVLAEPSRAIDIINDMERLYRGDASRAEMTMMVQTPQYERTMKMSAVSQGKEKSFIRILNPRKDRGIATLKLDREMWNYFPKINKVIKVPPSMMMGSWMGSDFTNDDLVKQTSLTEEYELSLEETETTWRITLTPKAQTVTVWGRIDYLVDRKLKIPLAQNFFDDRGEMVRTLKFKDPKAFSGRLLPSRLEMVPLHKEGHKTVIMYDTLEFDPPDVTEQVFSLRNLKSRF